MLYCNGETKKSISDTTVSDDVPANNTIWVLGDSILTDAAGHYNFFKKKKDLDIPGTQVLYMENMYAIRLVSPGIYTAKQAKNIPNIVLNSLVDTLNVKAKVPHTLIILINDHRFWNHSDLLSYQMERILQRFIKEIRRIIEDRNLSLPPRAANWDYPRIFINRALPLPNNMTTPYPKGFKSNRRKYNKILERGASEHNYETINLPDFTSDNDNELFSRNGSITNKGYIQLWMAISDTVHKSDNRHRINMNKVMAKQLSAQITSGVLPSNQPTDKEELSDIELLDTPKQPVTKPTKRALVVDFNKCDRRNIDVPPQSTSPQSTISEYYTSNPNTHHINKQYNQNAHQNKWNHPRTHGNQHNHHKPTFKGKRRNMSKSSWRDGNRTNNY